MITVNQFCCGFTLKNGTTCIGVLGTLISSFLFASSVMSICTPHMDTAFAANHNISETEREHINTYISITSKVSVMTALLLAGQVIASFMLIFGAIKERPRHIRNWIVYTIISSAALLVIYLLTTALAFKYAGAISGFSVIFTTLVCAVIVSYFLIVVYSFHNQLYGDTGPLKYNAV